MGPPGLWVLLPLLLLGAPARPDGPGSLCDPRVLERFIREAQDTERGLAGCGSACDLPEPVPVPDPGVNFNDWRQLDASRRGWQVAGGQAVLVAAVLRARELLPAPGLRPALDRTYSAVRSLAHLLRRLRPQVTGPGGSGGVWGDLGARGGLGGAPGAGPPPAVPVRSLPRLLRAHASFLRGKVRLFLADACPR
ncbi:erythropoietin [Rhea pennata]|uniref:erythropoietin n=1 Tax=Rhea pennata TaxID=8795 RepID=UPI002E25A222